MSPNPPKDPDITPHRVIAVLSEWAIAAVRLALAEHEEGNFESSAQLAEGMLRDPQIAGDLNARVRELASRSALPFCVEPSDEGDGRKRQSVADEMKALWWQAHPESTIAAVMRDRIMIRAAVGWISWTEEWAPILHPLPVHGLHLEETPRRRWLYRDGDGFDHEVTPGDGRWFLDLPDGERSWMLGAVRPLGIPFALDHLVLRAFAQFCERHGLPVLAVYEAFASTDNIEGAAGDGATAHYQRLQRALKGGILRLPLPPDRETPPNDAKWLELSSESWKGMEQLLLELRRRKSLALRGRDYERKAALGGDGEAAAGEQKNEFLAADAETLSTALREQVWKPWALFNHGDARLAGWGRWDTRPPMNVATRAGTLKTAGEALALLEAQGVDTEPVVAELGLQRRLGWKPPAPNETPPKPAAEPEPPTP
jgi:hypothetical protein